MRHFVAFLLCTRAIDALCARMPTTHRRGALTQRRHVVVAAAPRKRVVVAAATQQPAATQPAAAPRKRVVVVGAGWAGLATAWSLSKAPNVDVTLVDAAPVPGGVVRDGFETLQGRPAEAGQHGFWAEYWNIYELLDELKLEDDPLTGYAQQGQYSPRGLEAVWPVYRDQQRLPTGLAQAAYTKFLKLSPFDLLTAAPLVAAFSEFLDGDDKTATRYDELSFKDLCSRLGVSQRLYAEAFEPMILTGLFAPGEQCSAAAALGMAYFFVLKSQTAFDVRWCRGNIGRRRRRSSLPDCPFRLRDPSPDDPRHRTRETRAGDLIFAPWCEKLRENGVDLKFGTKVVGLETSGGRVDGVRVEGDELLKTDDVVFAVGMRALKGLARAPALAALPEFQRFGNLRGTDVLATRLFLDRDVETPYARPSGSLPTGPGRATCFKRPNYRKRLTGTRRTHAGASQTRLARRGST